MLDLNAVVVPAGIYAVSELVSSGTGNGETAEFACAQAHLPFSITFVGVAGSDAEVLRVASIFEGAMKDATA